MTDSITKRMLRPFIQVAPAPMFLSGLFQSPPENFHTSETVEIDIQRDGEDIAVPVVDLSTGHRYNENSEYSNKEMKPPAFLENFVVEASKLLGRDPGENPFAEIDYEAKAIRRAQLGLVKLQNKIRRGVEHMSSETLFSSTGDVTLVNAKNQAVYKISYPKKTALYPTSGAVWAVSGSTGDPEGDVSGLAEKIRGFSGRNPDMLVFGDQAWLRAKKNKDVQASLERDRLGLGQLAPEHRGRGGTFQGFIWIGSYRFEAWTYNGMYRHPVTGTMTRYVPDDKVLVASREARLDLSFGAIPSIRQARALEAFPPRIQLAELGVDLTVSTWLELNGRVLNVEAGTRPLAIPTEIDSFGVLTVQLS